ncbi:MAG: M15 family metallopeptidase, partial [bacterium]|nr:M15 family metallopeptidase [bacterium]
YKPNKLDLYLKYSNTYNNIDYFKIIDLINNKNFNEKNIDKYITLLEKSDDIKAIINYVNKYPDKKDIDYTTLSFFKEKYFIYDNLDRYIAYHKENKDLSFKEVITRINSNLDYNFYEDAKPCDTSKGMYTLVNKYFYLDEKYIPEDIVSVDKNYTVYNAKINKTVYDNFMKLANDAKDENLTIKITTGYRDYNFQNTLYNNYVKADGVINADKYSARPGYSEHQLGYSVDLTNAKNVSFDEFEDTEEFRWLKDNAYKYGFILRYPKDKEYITGYIYEAWHYRYVGVDIASYIYKNDITYEEYYEYFLR